MIFINKHELIISFHPTGHSNTQKGLRKGKYTNYFEHWLVSLWEGQTCVLSLSYLSEPGMCVSWLNSSPLKLVPKSMERYSPISFQVKWNWVAQVMTHTINGIRILHINTASNFCIREGTENFVKVSRSPYEDWFLINFKNYGNISQQHYS